ncbi:DUF6745 domain-containing protein [Catenulispora subtropica]|uniref:DUF6745 domain-containing protein n=1 Tax=Catenulispora subtropica TaxID=450798 RepID=A0ABN2T0W5_9ACTN
MGSRISRLTERTAALAAIRQEWLDAQSCTLPADRYEAEFGIALAYDSAGLTPPRTVVWVPDPALGAVVAAVLANRGTRTSGMVWSEARQRGRRAASLVYTNRAWDQAHAATRFPTGRVESATRSAALGLTFTTRSPKTPVPRDPFVLQSEWRATQTRIEASMATWGLHAFWSHGRVDYRKRGVRVAMEAVGAPEKDLPQWLRYRTPQYLQVKECLDWALGQQEHLEELALLDALGRLDNQLFTRLHHDTTPFRPVDGIARVARSAGWWWPFEDVAVVCERPSVRALDREGRLHAEDGPALAYPDGGFSAYFWHGRVVPRWAVLEPTVARIATEPNVEVRRCAIESMGWARFTEEAELTLLDECPDPGNPGQWLSLHSVPGKVWGTPAHVLVCTNGSVDLDGGRHTFGLLVPVTVGTALGAAAWGYGLTADEYAQLQRRA